MPSAKTQKMASLPAQHGPSLARDALLQAYAPIALSLGIVCGRRVRELWIMSRFG